MRKLFTIVSLLSLTMVSCTTDEKMSEEKGEGRVSITCDVATEVVDTRANVTCTTPSEADFALEIDGVDIEYAAKYASLAEFAEDNYLHHGKYKATVKTGDVTAEGYDMAAFAGSEEFTVVAREDIEVKVTATIVNALVKVEVTEAFKSYFPGGHSLKLTTAAGNEFDVTKQTEPLFIAPESFTITGTATKQPNQSGAEGLTVTLPEYHNETLAEQTLYTIKLDVENAGSAALEITLNDNLVESYDIEQELNDYAEEK